MDEGVAVEQITLLEAVRRVIEDRLMDLHVALPCQVVSYNADLQTVVVTPQVNRFIPDFTGNYITEQLPQIQDVPVQFPGGGGFFASFPIQPGDFVFVVFSERSIANWRSSGAQSDPGDVEKHGLDGGIAIPCIRDDSSPIQNASSTDMILGNDSTPTARIELTATGEVHLGAGASHPILQGDNFESALNTMIGALATALAAVATWANGVVINNPANDPMNLLTPTLDTALGTTLSTAISTFTSAAAAAKSLTSKTV